MAQPSTLPPGLSAADVIAQRAAGLGNNVHLPTSRSYLQIFQENLFTFINAAFFTLSLVMLLLGRYGDSILVVVVIFGGVLINLYQEIWAKRKLDEIALLMRPKATVIREGVEQSIDPSELVLGDVLTVQAGDQVVVDGAVIGPGRIDVDESLLTGESDLIPKQAGDRLYSGSFCVSGRACYVAEQVGASTVAFRLTTGARAFRQILTPLQREINLVIRVFLLIACFMWILVGISFLSQVNSLNELVQRAAVIAGLVPAGLLLAITLAYGLGAVRMVGRRVLIQQANAVESLSNVNILCLDKTGTLTTNQLQLQRLVPVGMSEAALRSRLGCYGASVTSGTKTSEAIAAACPGDPVAIGAEVPFNSARKWSAIALEPAEDTGDRDCPAGVYVLGAPEVLAEALPLSPDIQQSIVATAKQGLRVVLFAYSPDRAALGGDTDPKLPQDLVLLGVLHLSDELRPEAKGTLDRFARAGIAVKIISGDHPETVAALARQAGVRDSRVISGSELAQMSPAARVHAARSHHVFGRVTPEQKAELIQALRQQGDYVAMIGDGVNDVLSLKQANLAIAMESGSKATRSVADIVLLKDSFGSLPRAFLEGQRIRNGIQDVMKLFMIRTFCVTLLIFATAIATDSFPMANKQSAVVTLLGVGFPSMALPIWAKPGALPQRSLMRSILHFTVPATLTLTLVALMVYLFYLVVAILDLSPYRELADVDYQVPRSALVTILVMGELLLIPFLKPPTRAWVGGEPLCGDWRYTWVALGLLGLYFLIVALPPVANFFELLPLPWPNYGFIGFIALEWCFVLRAIWRSRFLDRFLGVDLS